MATTYPTAIWPAEVEVSRVAAQAVHRNPAALTQQVLDLGGRAWRIIIRSQPLCRDDAETLLAWLHALDLMTEAFWFDLDPWCPGVSPAPGSRLFMLASPEFAWRSRMGGEFSVDFEAVEVVARPVSISGTAAGTSTASGDLVDGA